MEKFENYHHPERHYMHSPGAKWIDKPVVGIGCPYSDRKAGPLRYTLGYRGYELEVSRDLCLAGRYLSYATPLTAPSSR
jgi:hypothetical protein